MYLFMLQGADYYMYTLAMNTTVGASTTYGWIRGSKLVNNRISFVSTIKILSIMSYCSLAIKVLNFKVMRIVRSIAYCVLRTNKRHVVVQVLEYCWSYHTDFFHEVLILAAVSASLKNVSQLVLEKSNATYTQTIVRISITMYAAAIKTPDQ